jgi:hypothetical protein
MKMVFFTWHTAGRIPLDFTRLCRQFV